mgnify:FL=1
MEVIDGYTFEDALKDGLVVLVREDTFQGIKIRYIVSRDTYYRFGDKDTLYRIMKQQAGKQWKARKEFDVFEVDGDKYFMSISSDDKGPIFYMATLEEY